MSQKVLGRLITVPLREYWADEARDFTRWLAQPDNLALLSDTLNMELELENTEVPVGPYKADMIARDNSSNMRVVIENQLEKTNHDHLGKILTYASGMDAAILIWIAREFSEEHRRALDFLNEKSAPNLQCYGLEIQLWRIGDSTPAPQFKVVSSPNEYTSEVKTEQAFGELSQTKALYLDFWIGFKQYCSLQKTTLTLRKPRPQHWFSIAIGRSKFQIALTASLQRKRIGCEIYLRGKSAKIAFNLLTRQRQEIEQITGALDWQELPNKQDCRIVLYRQGINLLEQQTWVDAYAWYKTNAEKFQQAFALPIKLLPNFEIEQP